MNTHSEEDLAFYKGRIPALSSPDWEYVSNPTSHAVFAWHHLNVFDQKLNICGRFGIKRRGANIYYFVEVRSNENEYPGFVISRDIKINPRPNFDGLHFEALQLANQIIKENRDTWIKRKEDWINDGYNDPDYQDSLRIGRP